MCRGTCKSRHIAKATWWQVIGRVWRIESHAQEKRFGCIHGVHPTQGIVYGLSSRIGVGCIGGAIHHDRVGVIVLQGSTETPFVKVKTHAIGGTIFWQRYCCAGAICLPSRCCKALVRAVGAIRQWSPPKCPTVT